jgi:hypothetical protein
MLFAGAAERNLQLCWLALDLAIPPLSLLAILLLFLLVLSGLASLFSFTSLPLILSMLCLLLSGGSLVASWRKYGRDVLPPSAATQVLSYLVKKIPMYITIFLRRSGLHWIRTDRTGPLS